MKNGVSFGADIADPQTGAGDVDLVDAIADVEAAVVQRLYLGGARHAPERPRNAFGDSVSLEQHAPGGFAAQVHQATAAISRGERVGLLASARELLTVREALAAIAARRLATVFHALEPVGGDAAHALAELGWALLYAADVAESVDLTLVARRAAEDSGTPVLGVQDPPRAGRHQVAVPLERPQIAGFVGPADARMRAESDPSHPSHAEVDPRALADRVPFALASALRDLESLTGRKRDVLTRNGLGQGADAPLVFLAVGSLGEFLLDEVARLRADGHDVGAVKLTAFRPFPGPRAVRLLGRAHAITVIEHTDLPLAQSNAVTRELKAAFADALTWAPDYPGIGRIPRIHSAVMSSRRVDARDVDAILRNMLAGEQGKRFLSLTGGATPEGESPASRAHL